MKIRGYEEKDLELCAELLICAFNGEPWGNQWTLETAKRYLSEFSNTPRFVGFVAVKDGKIIGAAFCHEKTWFTSDELFVDEFYLSPDFQRRGYGREFLGYIESYIAKRKLSGFRLLTNRDMPAFEFYRKNGFLQAEPVIYMYKDVDSSSSNDID